MSEQIFKTAIIAIAAIIAGVFCRVEMLPLIANPDVVGALAAWFANPYSSGYSADVIACWAIFGAWIFYEAQAHGIARLDLRGARRGPGRRGGLCPVSAHAYAADGPARGLIGSGC